MLGKNFLSFPSNTAPYEKFMKKVPLTYFYSIRKVHKDLITREAKSFLLLTTAS